MEPIRPQNNRLAWKLFWAFLIVSLFPMAVMLALAFVFSGEQLLGMPANLQQRLLIALIALTLSTIGLVWLVTARLGQRIGTLARMVRLAAQGRAVETSLIGGNDEIAETAQWFNRMSDQIAHQQALLMSQDNEENTTRRQAAALVAQQALMAGSLDDLMRSAVDLFLRHFGCSFGALYLLESQELASKIHITLAYTAGTLGEDTQNFAKRYNETRINLDQVPTMDWMVGRALGSRRPQVGPAAVNSVVYEAVLPLVQPSSDGPRAIGALDLLSTSRVSDARVGPFSVRTVAEMQGIANVLALAIGGFTTATAIRDGALPAQTGTTPSGPRLGSMRLDIEAIYAAGSRIALAQTVDQAMDALRNALRNSPYASVILTHPIEGREPVGLRRGALDEQEPSRSTGSMHVVVCKAVRRQPPGMNEPPLVLPSPRLSVLDAFFQNRIEQENRHEPGTIRQNPLPLMLYDLDIQEEGASSGETPVELISIARRMGCRSAAYLPAMRDGHLVALLMIGATPETVTPLFRPDALEPFQNLAILAAAALERIQTASFTHRKLAEMESLWQFTQAISVETNLNVLLRLLHQQIEYVMGALDSFAVGLYEAATNTVQIPYMIEGGKLLDIPPFPLGAGLSSEVIRNRKPLLLSTMEEVQRLSASSGSLLVGEEPRSWLGAPMIYAGEVVGLIIVQDTNQEGRFTQPDAQLLATLAAQVAVVVRNARLLDATRRQARQERLVNEISGRIRRAVDIQAILKTTTDELAQALGARRASIRISLDAASEAATGNLGELVQGSPLTKDAVPVLPIQREITKPDQPALNYFPDDVQMLEIPLVTVPALDDPKQAQITEAYQEPEAASMDAPESQETNGAVPAIQPDPAVDLPATHGTADQGEAQEDKMTARVAAGRSTPVSAAATANTGEKGAEPEPSGSNEAVQDSMQTPQKPPARPVWPAPGSSAAAAAPAPSRPRPKPSTAFTLDEKEKSQGSEILRPARRRVSPFIDPETDQSAAKDVSSTGSSTEGGQPSAGQESQSEQRSISTDDKKRLQNANTQPLTDPNLSSVDDKPAGEEGTAGK